MVDMLESVGDWLLTQDDNELCGGTAEKEWRYAETPLRTKEMDNDTARRKSDRMVIGEAAKNEFTPTCVSSERPCRAAKKGRVIKSIWHDRPSVLTASRKSSTLVFGSCWYAHTTTRRLSHVVNISWAS